MSSSRRAFTDGELTAIMNGLQAIASSFLAGQRVTTDQFRVACGFRTMSPAGSALLALGGSPWVKREMGKAATKEMRWSYRIVGAPQYRDELRAYLPAKATVQATRHELLEERVAKLEERVAKLETALAPDDLSDLGETLTLHPGYRNDATMIPRDDPDGGLRTD